MNGQQSTLKNCRKYKYLNAQHLIHALSRFVGSGLDLCDYETSLLLPQCLSSQVRLHLAFGSTTQVSQMIRKLLRRLATGPEFPAIAPDSPFIAVGDIHGRADLLKRFLDMRQTYPVICVGDYVDRGDESAEVLHLLQQRPDITCLSGNHEEMMLDFLKNPDKAGPMWLRHGGLQTLASFGVAGVTDTSGKEALGAARDALKEAMGPKLMTWLLNLPTRWQSGNVAVVHAGADPLFSIADQRTKTLHWGHPDFAKTGRKDGVWVIHGHTIVDAPIGHAGRIAIDTGAYATGRLTTALVEPGKTTFATIT